METIKQIISQYNKKKPQPANANTPELCATSSDPLSPTQIQTLRKANSFLHEYSPNKQELICGNRKLCFFGDFPTLAKLSQDFGPNVPSAWLVPQLTDLSEFCGCKQKFTAFQMKQCALIIAQTYYYLKVSELMLFFYQFKQGRYGQFYGAIDPIKIMSALQDFRRERFDAISDYENEQREQKAALEPKGISRQQHEAHVRAALNGDTQALLSYAPAAQSNDPVKIRQFLISLYPQFT